MLLGSVALFLAAILIAGFLPSLAMAQQTTATTTTTSSTPPTNDTGGGLPPGGGAFTLPPGIFEENVTITEQPPTGGEPPTLPPGAILPNVHRVQGDGFTIKYGYHGSDTADCPSGETLIGGGFTDSGGVLTVYRSFPIDENTWYVEGSNRFSANFDGYLYAFALCMEPMILPLLPPTNVTEPTNVTDTTNETALIVPIPTEPEPEPTPLPAPTPTEPEPEPELPEEEPPAEEEEAPVEEEEGAAAPANEGGG